MDEFGVIGLGRMGGGLAHQALEKGLRVVGASGERDDLTQYSDTTTMPTNPQAECFGAGSGGSGEGVSVPGANALGVVVEAAKSRGRLNPLLLTDTLLKY